MRHFRPVIISAMIAAMICSPALAGDHLVPEAPAVASLISPVDRFGVAGYPESLATAFDRFVRVFVITEGSPFPESVVGLKESDGHFNIFGMQPSGPTTVRPAPQPPPLKLVGTDGKYRKEAPPKPVEKQQYVLKTCRQDIDDGMASRVVKVWDSVLLQTRPDAGKPQIAADAPTFIFGSRMPYSIITGVALDVPHDSRPAWLGRAGFALSSICWNWNWREVKGAQDPRIDLEESVHRLEQN